MGYNTTVFILNDQLSSIERSPREFVDGIVRNLRGDDNYVIGQTTVMPTEHADVFRLYATQCNSIIDLSSWSAETMRLVNGESFQRDSVERMIRMARSELDRLEEKIASIPRKTDD